MSTPTSGHSRRAVLGALTVAAIGTPIALGQPWAHAASTVAPAPDGAAWHPDPAKDRLKAFEGIEADRAHLHPGREYVVVEDDHWRFSISTDDRDSTGGGDRQRTEAKGMVTGGKPVKMRDGETWRIAYEMFVLASMHGTDRFTHIFQAKTPKNNGGPWVTLSLSRSGGAELIRLQADGTSGNPSIASHELEAVQEKWTTVEITMRIGEKGSAGLVLRPADDHEAATSILAQGTKNNIKIPAQGDYVRPKWGIYRSLRSNPADIENTFLLFRSFSATKLG